MGNNFADETTPTTVGDGRYEATISPGWNLRPLPHGGLVTAVAVRAMTDLLGDPTQQPRTLHTTFVAQVAEGAVTIHAELVDALSDPRAGTAARRSGARACDVRSRRRISRHTGLRWEKGSVDLAFEPTRPGPVRLNPSPSSRPRTFDEALTLGAGAAAAWAWHAVDRAAVVATLATIAASAEDAHHVKYTLACIDAMRCDPDAAHLDLAAAAYLAAWWSGAATARPA